MLEVLSWVGAVTGPLAIALAAIFRSGAKQYVDEKAKNMATLEDTAKITGEVEAVRSLYGRQSHAWKWIFEQEYQTLREVWGATWEFQATARSLRPLVDHLPIDEAAKREVFMKRHKEYIESARKFQDTVIKHQPFIPPSVYSACLELRAIVGELRNDFEMSLDDGFQPDWRRISECGNRLDVALNGLNEQIRAHVHAAASDARQSVRGDTRSGRQLT